MKKEETAIQMILSAWKSQVESINKTLSVLSDEDLNAEVSPGKNKAFWIVGHLAAVNDFLFNILELGEKINPTYAQFFTKGDVRIKTPSVSETRKYWADTSTLLTKKMAGFTTDDWLQKHGLVSAEDFLKEPLRNKLNVLLSRTSHIAHHRGQLVLLEKK